MEVYVGFLEYIDYYVGWFVDGLQCFGVFDDMLVFYIIGDNGVLVEGMINGIYNEMLNFNGLVDIEMLWFMIDWFDKFGGLEFYNYYLVGWVYVMDIFYQWIK